MDILNYLKEVVAFFFGSGMQFEAFLAMDWIRKMLVITNVFGIFLALLSFFMYRKVYVRRTVWCTAARLLSLFIAGFYLLQILVLFHFWGFLLQNGVEPAYHWRHQISFMGMFMPVLNLVLYIGWIRRYKFPTKSYDLVESLDKVASNR